MGKGVVRGEQVMSEVHLGCPPHHSGPYVSHFTICRSPRPEHNNHESGVDLRQEDMQRELLTLDEDGDLVLTQRKNPNNTSLNVGLTIQHTITSSLLEVGLQVWKAALVLTDLILQISLTSPDLNDVIAIELGAGTGLVGIALARVARTVFITDKGVQILGNCVTNAHLNSSLMKFQESSVQVRELDWNGTWPPNATNDLPPQNRSPESRYLWSPSEIEEAESATILLAADVIYSDEFTDSFFSMLKKLMSRGSEKVLYLALEKQYNLDELDVVANGYSHFRTFFKVDEDHGEDDDGMLPRFLGKQIDLTEIPQYIREYDRGRDLEVWKITYCRKEDVDD